MANCEQSSFSFWQFSDELRSQTRALEDQQWSQAASKLALVEKMRGLMLDPRLRKNPTPHSALTAAMNELEPSKNNDGNRIEKLSPARNSKNKQKPGDGLLNMKPYPNSSDLNGKNGENGQKNGVNPSSNGKEKNKNKSVNSGTVGQTQQNGVPLDKRFKSLPLSESLPRDETLGGYIFVCNNDTMQEDLRRQLFGLPQRYRDSVRAIRPGLPLFLYNYTTHQLHGVYEAAGFGGTNIDPTAWEDKKCKGESRFPAQVCIRIRSQCKSLEEDSFRPSLHHYDGPKFRLQLSVPETLSLLDLFGESGSSL